MTLCDELTELTKRGLWECENLLKCVPDSLWDKRYDGIPMWKYFYHMLYSMDRWFMNPCDPAYQNPAFHEDNMANLNVVPQSETVTRKQMEDYFDEVRLKMLRYIENLSDEELLLYPVGCDMTRFRLIVGQFRHWHRHMGVIYGFMIEDTGKWPYVLNQKNSVPKEPMPNFYPIEE